MSETVAVNGSTPATPEEDVATVVLTVILEEISHHGHAPQALNDDTDLVGSGLIDSFGLLELIGAVEDRLSMEIDFEALDADELTVVGPFCRYVAAAYHAAQAR